MANTLELDRLAGDHTGSKFLEQTSLFACIRVECAGERDASYVLARTMEVLSAVLAVQEPQLQVSVGWDTVLPAWFLSTFRGPICHDELARFMRLPIQERSGRAIGWTLENWLHWFTSSEREWLWWDGYAADPTTLNVMLAVTGIPFPVAALRHLLSAAGASAIEDPSPYSIS